MPTCLACAQGWPISTAALYAASSRSSTSRWIATGAIQKLSAPIHTQLTRRPGGTFPYQDCTVSTRRMLTTAVKSSTSTPSRKPQILTLLHKTKSFLDYALNKWPATKGSSETLSFWRGTLSGLSAELSAGEAVKPKVRVAGK